MSSWHRRVRQRLEGPRGEDGDEEEEQEIEMDDVADLIKQFEDKAEESDEELDDEHEQEIRSQLAASTVKRNADMFDSPDPTSGQLFVFVGKSDRGKTHFLKWLVQYQMNREINPIRFGIVFVRTIFKHSYDFVPKAQIYEGYDEEVLRKYVENLQEIFEEQGYVDPNFLILDDQVGILNNRTAWFTNFIGTFRHLNINLFIAVQYLTGTRSVSPIMREQTNFAIMFNSKTHRTLNNLWENYGQLFEKKREFKDYMFANTEPSTVGPYVCIVYQESEDKVEQNYTPMRAPK